MLEERTWVRMLLLLGKWSGKYPRKKEKCEVPPVRSHEKTNQRWMKTGVQPAGRSGFECHPSPRASAAVPHL